ncbi:MAG TPA: glycosyltransferase [candidate division Zixibacteria bacterium]|nr:glycosyltransferase [candidate division Zixibacteria bacterium]
MQSGKVVVLSSKSISEVDSARQPLRWLVMAAGKSHYFSLNSYAVDLKTELGTRFNQSVEVEISAATMDSIASFRKLHRTIPRYDAVHLFYDGTASFFKSILPVVLVARFYGKSTALFYYPNQMVDRIPRLHSKTMPLFERVFVGSKYQQRELAKQNVSSEVLLPPIDINSWPARKISGVLPHLILSDENLSDAGAQCAIKAYSLVKQKYPRTTISIITSSREYWSTVAEQIGLTLDDENFVNSQSADEITRAFGNADIYVNCSLVESTPTPLLAALVSGMPVISFETYGAREIIHNCENGILIEHNDYNQLADRIIDLSEQPELVTKISTEAAKFRQVLLPEKFVQRFL